MDRAVKAEVISDRLRSEREKVQQELDHLRLLDHTRTAELEAFLDRLLALRDEHQYLQTVLNKVSCFSFFLRALALTCKFLFLFFFLSFQPDWRRFDVGVGICGRSSTVLTAQSHQIKARTTQTGSPLSFTLTALTVALNILFTGH